MTHSDLEVSLVEADDGNDSGDDLQLSLQVLQDGLELDVVLAVAGLGQNLDRLCRTSEIEFADQFNFLERVEGAFQARLDLEPPAAVVATQEGRLEADTVVVLDELGLELTADELCVEFDQTVFRTGGLHDRAEVVHRPLQDGLEEEELLVDLSSVLGQRGLEIDLGEVVKADGRRTLRADVEDRRQVAGNAVASVVLQRHSEEDVAAVDDAAFQSLVDGESFGRKKKSWSAKHQF